MPKGDLGPNYGRLWRHCDECGKKAETRPPGTGITGGLCFACAAAKRKRISDIGNQMKNAAQEVCIGFAHGLSSSEPQFMPAFRRWLALYEEFRTTRGESPKLFGPVVERAKEGT